MDYFGITNRELAGALGVDPSLVSRWLNGQRKLKAASGTINVLAEYILTSSRRIHDIQWLKTQLERDELPVDLSTVYRIKQSLILWLASDGEDLRRNLGETSSPPEGQKGQAEKKPAPLSHIARDTVKIGCLELVLSLEPLLSGLPRDASADIFLSHDEIGVMINEDFSRLLLKTIEEKHLKVRLMICISGNTRAMSRIIAVYMRPLVSGRLRLSVVHGMTHTVTSQMHLLIPGKAAILVTETPGGGAPPVAALVDEENFLKEIQLSFEEAIRYAQPVLNIYDDDFSRNILEIIYQEFCTPGALDVVKDNINPMYMAAGAYDRFLDTQGHNREEYAWRSAEFRRFKSGLDETLKGGSVFREILSMKRLAQIAREGFCRMPGLYFMTKGFVLLDAEGCAAVLNGYIRYLEAAPNFQVLILDDISILHAENCWQLKKNHHLAINHWSGGQPVMIHSDQLLLLREFQAHFDSLWARGRGSISSRGSVVATLQEVLKQLNQGRGKEEKQTGISADGRE